MPDSEGTDHQGDGRPHAISRRAFGMYCAAYAPALGALLGGCAKIFRRGGSTAPLAPVSCSPAAAGDDGFDYVVVGSGAGGGPLAANLARAGYRVLLLEAGGDAEPYTYQVPAFHALASEDERLRWDYFVQHYTAEERQRRDWKYHAGDAPDRQGILYPRAGTLGGCTAHNAMITIYPHNSDWDDIAQATGDPSWRSENMRRYFQRLERCQYVWSPADPADPAENAGRHGFSGWLTTELPDATLALRDRELLRLVKSAVKVSLEDALRRSDGLAGIERKIAADFDPNDWRLVTTSAEGVCVAPLATIGGRRNGTREYIQRVRAACPGNLVVRTGALVTRVLLDGENRAVGVEYLEGEHLFRADPGSRAAGAGTLRTARAGREVILAAGAFNTPQLLQLSGIGPGDELARHGLEVRVDLPGVGRNLQDRYEIGVVLELKKDFSLLDGATFREPAPGETPDPVFREWLDGKGPYTTNGAVVSIIRRSDARRPEPDLVIFGLAGRFEGYFPGYAKEVTRDKRFFTWAILKAHTNNTAGTVTLRSADPRDVPRVNFRYFDEGSDRAGDDLEAVVDGVEYVRRMVEQAGDFVVREASPGERVSSRDEIREFVKSNAWGHHASCTCKMGPSTDATAVVDSRFRVHGVKGLRVVDASVFPRIPGFFIVTPIYMISEKATDVLLEDAARS